MANHKSSEKRVLVTKQKNTVNTIRRSVVKTSHKKAVQAIASGDKTVATTAVRNAESAIMKSAGKIMPKKRASRKVSRLAKSVAKIA